MATQFPGIGRPGSRLNSANQAPRATGLRNVLGLFHESAKLAWHSIGGPCGAQTMSKLAQKMSGSYYTPDEVVSSLVRWAVRHPTDELIDPSCGDGRFLAGHRKGVGVEQDLEAARIARDRAPAATIHTAEFFAWAAATNNRFDCVVGNPPFIRYQTFKGAVRETALRQCSRLGAHFSGLSSSWAPFLVAAAGLLKPGGRMAFVVPAELGHAPYAAPLIEFLAGNFEIVHIMAVREKLFPELSEDCWLLYADGYSGRTEHLRFSTTARFKPTGRPPRQFDVIAIKEWRDVWRRRLRPYVVSQAARDLYRLAISEPGTYRLGDIANVGIGYVSGANEFFHLRPSDAERWNIPKVALHPTVRNGRMLPAHQLTIKTVRDWLRRDEPILLLRLPKTNEMPSTVRRYLDTDQGRAARQAYKCRTRDPWYSVPDVHVPDFFLTYMSGLTPSLVFNAGECTCTNSVHSVRVRDKRAIRQLVRTWDTTFVKLSCELEGHSLGGGMLKVEPREAAQIVLPSPSLFPILVGRAIDEALTTLRGWRHYDVRD